MWWDIRVECLRVIPTHHLGRCCITECNTAFLYMVLGFRFRPRNWLQLNIAIDSVFSSYYESYIDIRLPVNTSPLASFFIMLDQKWICHYKLTICVRLPGSGDSRLKKTSHLRYLFWPFYHDSVDYIHKLTVIQSFWEAPCSPRDSYLSTYGTEFRNIYSFNVGFVIVHPNYCCVWCQFR